MAKRTRKLNIEKLLKEGRGLGSGVGYKPWITIQDVPSHGRSTRVKGIKTQRQHEFLSDQERNYFYFLEYSDQVKDIREQFPLLPIEETLSIADELGYEHPRNPYTNENIVMTTDFLITIDESGKLLDLARTIKPKDELLNKRIIEKFEIERLYWERRNVEWAIVTDVDIDKTVANNISYFLSYYDIRNLDAFVEMNIGEMQDLILEFIRRTQEINITVREITTLFDKDMSLPKGTGIAVFKHLLARKIISIDLTKPFNIDSNVEVKLREKVMDKELIIS